MTIPDALTIPAGRVDERLNEVLDAYRAEWGVLDPLFGETIDLLSVLVLSGGKRVRPAMAYWGYVGAGGDTADPSISNLGAALELLQAFALFHDDVMDGSPTRRGAPTAHVQAIRMHEANNWAGEARRYGEAIAILAGDVSLVLSDVLLAEVNSDVRRLWNDLRVEVNLGQFLDVVGTARGDVPLQTAERIVEYKTARYTIVRPLQMGAALAGRNDLETSLGSIGTPLGIAFQLRDDMLGVFGEPEVTGKPVGDDLREGKPTPLLARARSAASASQADFLELIGTDLSTSQIDELQSILHDTGAVAGIELQIEALTEQALDAIARTPLAGDANRHLAELATFLASRTS
ncbi:MAG: geranylgeranyl diphosphate synthase type I [Verrucomicrobiales bacterium]